MILEQTGGPLTTVRGRGAGTMLTLAPNFTNFPGCHAPLHEHSTLPTADALQGYSPSENSRKETHIATQKRSLRPPSREVTPHTPTFLECGVVL